MIKDVFSWQLNKNHTRYYTVEVWIYDTIEEMIESYRGRGKGFVTDGNVGVEAMFIPSNCNGRFIGSLRFGKDKLTMENIIHESFHAGIELMRHMGRRMSERYNEKIVDASAQLANMLLNNYKELINE